MDEGSSQPIIENLPAGRFFYFPGLVDREDNYRQTGYNAKVHNRKNIG
jgi:hypothetical protein